MAIQRATTLAEFHLAFRPEPLTEAEDIARFYRDELNELRDPNWRKKLAMRIRRAKGATHFKGAIAGHEGVGKTTELEVLLGELHEDFRVVRVDAFSDLNPQQFRVSDVFLAIMLNVLEEYGQEFNTILRNDLWEGILDFFPEYRIEIERTKGKEAGAEVELGLSALSKLKLSIKAKSDEKQKQPLDSKRMSELLELLNRILDVCQRGLKGKDLLIYLDNFEKGEIPVDFLKEMFLTFGSLLWSFHAHLLCTLPPALIFSDDAARLPFERDAINFLYDIPVLNEKHEPHEKGMAAIRSVVLARSEESLFAEGQVDALIRASGGSLRCLFSLIREAGLEAELAGNACVTDAEARRVVDLSIAPFRSRLGTGPYDTKQVTWDQKLAKLLEVYEGKAIAPDDTLYSLLRSRAVLFVNGRGRYAVHPIAVDILRDAGKLAANCEGGVRPL
ncbi:MAG: hypothetical protein JNM66_08115 [Bryobacterales bacterium]|nr:hypothetical protein [Bryobacterales bacterium]